MSVRVPPTVTSDVIRFAQLVDYAWSLAGYPRVRLTSWYRDPYDNAVAGGMPSSQHLTGTAIDVMPDSEGDRFANAARSVGLIPIDEGSHWHVQLYSRAEHAEIATA